jgi:hypothetical protein
MQVEHPVDSLLEQLGNEAVLVMYLAEELPPEDAAEVRQLLESDARLREQLETLRRAHSEFLYGMAILDGTEPPPVAAAVATRDVTRAVERWRIAEALRRPRLEPSRAGLRYPWWAYPMATAAAVLIAFLAWWGNTASTIHIGSSDNGQAMVSGQGSWESGMPQGYSDRWRGGRGGGGGRITQAMEAWRPLVSDEPLLTQAEEQLAALSDAPDTDGLFPPEMNW